MKAEEVVRRLRLEPHPEGGFYREIYRAPGEGRTAVTSIYFLLEGGPSRWHRVDAPEIWVWHAGAPLVLETEARRVVLGPLEEGHELQATVPAHEWQRCRVLRRLEPRRLHRRARLHLRRLRNRPARLGTAGAASSAPGSRAVSMKRSRRDFVRSSFKVELRLFHGRFFDNQGWVADQPALAD